ncbi:MAG TPA: aspartate aminotransferase family protein [Woeseiaceae bacterium]|nr:aspartate aminotransferase family protein [Woeseiaceae bacterium]
MAAIEKRSRQDLQEMDKSHHLHPFTDHKALHAQRSRIITRAEGVYIYEADGHKILDGMSGLWCVNAGYGRQEIIDAANEQMKELPYYNSFFQCSHPPAIELAAFLKEVSQPHLNRVFFAGSGSESNDTIIRMVRTYWDLMGQPGRHTIISRVNAYHGSTVAAASLSGMKPMHKQSGLPIPGIVHVDQPYWYGSDQSLSPDEFGLQAARSIEKKIKEVGPDKVAAFIGEPIQGAGGVIVPPRTYWPEVQRICDEYGILLISDEVITGFGRLGEWFGADYFDTRPDFMPFAKGVSSGYLPLGGVYVGDRVADVLIEKGGEFFHGYTYSGHPVSCAVALANLKLIRRENLVTRIRDDIGPYLQEKWRALTDHPLVGDSRMVGLMGAFELVRKKQPIERFDEKQRAGVVLRDHLLDGGVCMRAVGDTIVCAPPFVLSHSEADEMMNATWKALDLAQADLAG